MFRLTCLALFALILPGSALAAPLELEPSSDWAMNYDMEACRLTRSFGTGEEKVVVQFIRYMPGPGFEAIVAGKMLSPKGKQFEHRFFPGNEPSDERMPLFGEREDGLTVWQFNTGLIPEEELEEMPGEGSALRQRRIAREQVRAAEIRSFELLKGVRQPVSLQTGPMDGAMMAMETCMDDLVREWGYDPLVQRERISAPEPKNVPARWIASDDYPSTALRQKLSGTVRFRLDIDETGSVDGCVIQEAFSDPAFQEVTCKLIKKRARFEPAVGADGNRYDPSGEHR
ncbi:MAG: TonB family protein [Allopontixanthobacter sediminis]